MPGFHESNFEVMLLGTFNVQLLLSYSTVITAISCMNILVAHKPKA